jgi:predicted type IV restriction endonuclease
MARIPKKIVSRFTKAVPKFQKVLKVAKDRDVNESDTVAILSDMLADVFGYDKYLEVTSEYAIRGTYCDLAIKIDNKIQFILEAKAIGIELKESHMRQAIDYGANVGVQWIILTNGIDWRLYRLKFEKPINYRLVCTLDFSELNPRNEKDQECLFLFTKEGLAKDIREDFYERVKSVNRFIIASLIQSEPVLNVIRRELRKYSEGLKIEIDEVEEIVKLDVLKRELVEGEEAEAAHKKVDQFYKKVKAQRKRQKKKRNSSTPLKQQIVADVAFPKSKDS